MRPGQTQTGMSSYQSPYICFHPFTWDWPKNELRPVTVVRQDFSAGGRWRVADDGWQVTGSGWQVTGSG